MNAGPSEVSEGEAPELDTQTLLKKAKPPAAHRHNAIRVAQAQLVALASEIVNLYDVSEIDDPAIVNSDKLIWRKPLLQLIQCVVRGIGVGRSNDLHAFVAGDGTKHVCRVQEANRVVQSYRQSLQRRNRQVAERLRRRARRLCSSTSGQPPQGQVQPVSAYRLKQIICGGSIERLNRIVFVTRDEHHVRCFHVSGFSDLA